MPNVSIYNQEGKTTGEMNLSDVYFGVKPKQSVIHQVMVGIMANARQTLAATKTRGEVRGGGKKPWKQKGTGRARQGSIRSPQWVGGGIAFGPRKERNFSQKINRKTKRQALYMVLSDKLATGQLVVLDTLKMEPAKTKNVALTLKNLPVGKTVLLVAPASKPAIVRMVRNMPNVTVVSPNSLGLVDTLNHRTLVFLKDAVESFEKLHA
jgi:large subunit ribosomal protein L4